MALNEQAIKQAGARLLMAEREFQLARLKSEEVSQAVAEAQARLDGARSELGKAEDVLTKARSEYAKAFR